MRRAFIFLLLVSGIFLICGGFPSQKSQQTDQVQEQGTLILNEISPWPSDGEVWVELINPGDQQ